ncbi:Eukaryotic translation initiation factor 3 subunit B [Gigaspora margarita]|uniref:Eukaryotic translation initiation factor 3 subunit B n=1 Tax=Gigaspora margarita TaxID=4874 RepID=A0A8H4A922_GIGMA|nr:Eukaryotic translation initiation factor 3 subunit B [Gigaspora margarita]
MPMNPDPKIGNLTSKGFLFIEFETLEQAAMTNWTETYVQWSPLDFSPNGKYLVTWSNEPITLGPNGGAGTPFGPEDEDVKLLFGMFMVGQQGQQRQQALSVYETPSMGLVGNKNIKIEGLIDFEWAPAFDKEKEKDKHSGEKKQREELLSYWTPEIGNQPARMTLLNIQFRRKKLYEQEIWLTLHIAKCIGNQMMTFYASKLTAIQKPKSQLSLTLKSLESVKKISPLKLLKCSKLLSPGNLRVNVLQLSQQVIPITVKPTQGGVTLKTSVSFYYLETDKETLEKKTSNIIYWSPQGRHVILATLLCYNF